MDDYLLAHDFPTVTVVTNVVKDFKHAKNVRALAAVGVLPIILSRPDKTHFEPLALLVFGLLPLTAVTLRAQLTPHLARYVASGIVSFSIIWGAGFLIVPFFVVDASAMTPVYDIVQDQFEGWHSSSANGGRSIDFPISTASD